MGKFGLGSDTASSPAPQPTRPQAAQPTRRAAPSPQPGTVTAKLESNLALAVKNGDGVTVNALGAQLLAAGYTQDQVMALIKKAQGQK